jgi:hypothetical protein
MEGDFLKSHKTRTLIQSFLRSKYPNCRFRIGYTIERNQWELGIGTSNNDTFFGNDFGLTSVLEKANNQQDFLNILLKHVDIQAKSIIKQSKGE